MKISKIDWVIATVKMEIVIYRNIEQISNLPKTLRLSDALCGSMWLDVARCGYPGLSGAL